MCTNNCYFFHSILDAHFLCFMRFSIIEHFEKNILKINLKLIKFYFSECLMAWNHIFSYSIFLVASFKNFTPLSWKFEKLEKKYILMYKNKYRSTNFTRDKVIKHTYSKSYWNFNEMQ